MTYKFYLNCNANGLQSLQEMIESLKSNREWKTWQESWRWDEDSALWVCEVTYTN